MITVNEAAYGKTNGGNYNDAYFSYKVKEAKLEMINHEYDQKIAFVNHDRHLNGWQKSKQIQMLQNQRKNKISKVAFSMLKEINMLPAKKSVMILINGRYPFTKFF